MNDLRYEATDLEGVVVISPATIFEDHRGVYVETFNQDIYASLGVGEKFIQDDVCFSRKGALRGFHGDFETWKIVSCIFGSMFLVLFDNRRDSPSYEKCFQITLSHRTFKQILLPPGIGNAYQALEDNTCFLYKQTTNYNRDRQFTIGCNDPRINVEWPIDDWLMSARDRQALTQTHA